MGAARNCGRLLDFEVSQVDPDALPTIQHIHGDSSNVSNLSAFCRRCNVADAQTRFVPVNLDHRRRKLPPKLMGRWSSIVPLRLCDDEQHWSSSWRQAAKSAREVLRGRPEVDGAWETRICQAFRVGPIKERPSKTNRSAAEGRS